MGKKYEVIGLEEFKKENEKIMIKKIISHNVELQKILLFLYDKEPASLTEIANCFPKFTRVTIWNRLNKLKAFSLVESVTLAETAGKNFKYKEEIKKKYVETKQKISQEMMARKLATSMRFYYTTPLGESLIPLCAKLLGLKLREKR